MTNIEPAILPLLAVTAALGLLVFAVVTTTAFVKVSVVLFLVRNALGTQSIPPNIVLYGAALMLTAFTSAPVFEQSYNRVAPICSSAIKRSRIG
ncbi:type III secretory pathway component EscR [Bradyrhizobium sp. GM22.5]